MFTDQAPEEDMSRGLAAKHGFKLVPSIRRARASVVVIPLEAAPDDDIGVRGRPDSLTSAATFFRAGGCSLPAVFVRANRACAWNHSLRVITRSI